MTRRVSAYANGGLGAPARFHLDTQAEERQSPTTLIITLSSVGKKKGGGGVGGDCLPLNNVLAWPLVTWDHASFHAQPSHTLALKELTYRTCLFV